jgi:hypothetical protein
MYERVKKTIILTVTKIKGSKILYGNYPSDRFMKKKILIKSQEESDKYK